MSKDASSNEIFEAFQRMINPMAFPMQNFLMGGMKLEDVERKISELQTVHHWLSTNLGMLELSIKTLEYQKALLTPSNKAGGGAKAEDNVENPFLNPAMWPWPYGQANTPAQDENKETTPVDKTQTHSGSSKSATGSKKKPA
jgi:hypothetical protein